MLNNGGLREALAGDLPPAVDIFRYYAGFATKIHGETIPVDGDYLCYTLRQPVGVCGQIVPWNYPLLMACWKVAPALACGNTVVLKPSEYTPLTALVLAELCKEAGVPDGVVNVVPGYGDPAGEALARHPDVDKIAFTGSIRTARRLLHASADTNLKKPRSSWRKVGAGRAHDADVDAVKPASQHLREQGRGLLGVEPRDRSPQGKGSVRREAGRQGACDARRQSARQVHQMGAQVSARQLETILRYIEAGKKKAPRSAGGERDTEGARKKAS